MAEKHFRLNGILPIFSSNHKTGNMTARQNREQAREGQVKNIIASLRVLFKSLQQQSKTVEKECGLTSAMLWMMWELFAHPDMKVSELAAALSIHASTCSNMLDKLEAKGLIARKRDRRDQREVHLLITDEGAKLLAGAPRPAQGSLSEALDKMSGDDLVKLADSLSLLVDSLQIKDRDDRYKPLFE